jgi:beta-N-acetylhexosaminidase
VSMPTKRRRNPSTPFLWTFFLGLLIGVSLGYVLGSGNAGQSPIQVAKSTGQDTDKVAATNDDNNAGEKAAASPEPKKEEKPAETPAIQLPPEQAAGPAPDSGTSTDKLAALPPPDASAEPPATVPEPTPPPPAAVPPPEPSVQTPANATPPAPSTQSPGARLMFIAVKGTTLDDITRTMLTELKPGGVVLLDENIENEQQTITLVTDIKRACGLGEGVADLPLIAVEQDGGPVNRLKLSKAPSPASLSLARDAAAVRGAGNAYADACKVRGISILLGPALDVYEHGADPSLQERCFGDNGPLVASLGLAFIAGVMDKGVIPVAKHFPGLGAAKVDTNESVVVIDKPARELTSSVYPFSEAATRNAPGILAGHIALPQVDKEVTRPASLSPVLLKVFLREIWQYKGVVLSADLNLGAITNAMKPEVAAVKALESGCDAVLFLDPSPGRVRDVAAAIDAAIAGGLLNAADIDTSKTRLDAWQAWLRAPEPLAGELPAVPSTRVAESAPPAATAPNEANVTPAASTPPAQVAEITESVALPPAASEAAPVQAQDGGTKQSETASSTITDAKSADVAVDTPTTPAPDTSATQDSTPEEKSTDVTPPADAKKIVHEIAKGESLGDIAKKYGVQKDEIIAWNKLPGPDLKYGKKLDIYVPEKVEQAAATELPDVAKTVEPAPEPEEIKPADAPVSGEAEANKPADVPAPTDATADKPSDTPAPAEEIANKPADTIAPVAADAGKVADAPDAVKADADKPAEPAAEPIDEKVELPIPLPEEVAKTSEEKKPAAAAESKPEFHTIEAGDTLTKIGKKYGVSVSNLQKWNNLTTGDIKFGFKLRLTPPPETKSPDGDTPVKDAAQTSPTVARDHTVATGDTLQSIADSYGIDVAELKKWNNIEGDTIAEGQKLKVHLPVAAE